MTSTVSSLPTPVPPQQQQQAPSPAHGMNGISSLALNAKLLSMAGALAINSPGGPGQQQPHLPTLNEPASSSSHHDSDSEAETVVLSLGRGRSRSNRRSNDESNNNHNNNDDDRLAAPSHKRTANGGADSKSSNPSSRSDRDANNLNNTTSNNNNNNNSNNDDDVAAAYSSELSSAPSSRAPSSKRPSAKDASSSSHASRKRTASPSRLTHSPPRRKIVKTNHDEPNNNSSSNSIINDRRSLKRKTREVSVDRKIKTEDESPRGVRIKSSPPVSPPPSGNTNGTTKQNNATPLSRPGHSRKRSVPHLDTSSSSRKTPTASVGNKHHKAKRTGGRPAALNFHDSDNEVKSTSSSRSNSPHVATNSRRRRPSLSGPAASPARLVGPGHKMKRDKTGRNQLHKVCGKGDLDEAKACLAGEPELLNEADNAGYLPIHAAALAGHDGIVAWLIDRGAVVDKPAEDLSTPLLDAVENGHIDVVNILLENGADPRHRNKAGQSSVDIAMTQRQQLTDEDERTAMEQVEEALKAALAKMKTKKRPDDETRKNESSSSRAASVASPSHFSPPPQSNPIMSGSSSRRRTGRGEPTRNEFLWLDAGKGGQAKLKQASRDGDMEMAGKLLESGIVPDPESMMLAARGGHLDVLNLLVAFGGDSDPDPKDVIRQHTKDKSQFPLVTGEETPLLATIGRNNIEVLKLLLRSESMKEPRRLDHKGRSYPEIARHRAGENWEEEVKLLQAAFDAAGPQKTKKSSREKLDSSSPVASRKELKEKERSKAERKELKADEAAKKAKRLRRRTASPAASSAMDDTAPSEREISPAIARTKLKDLDKQKRKERTVESDYSAISDSNATVDGTKTKKRRLVLGKDLASKEEKKEKPAITATKDEKPAKKRTDEMEVDHPPKREKEKDGKKKKEKQQQQQPEDEDVDMADAPRPKKKVADPERHAKREQSLDKRHRESSSSSSRPVASNDHNNSDADAVHTKADALAKKRRKMEEDDAKPIKKEERQEEGRKSKEERLAERESRRLESEKAAKLKAKAEKAEKAEKEKADKADKTEKTAEVAGKDSDEAAAALLERKREKRKRREEALKEQAAREAKEAESSTTKRSKERDTTASDIEGRKSRKEKDKDAMDVDTEVQPKRRKHSGDAETLTVDEAPAKSKKRKSNGASPAPSSVSDDKNSTRHLSDLSNGKSNRGSSVREETKKVEPKIEPTDEMLTEERERELERQRLEKEQKEQEIKEQERKKQEAARLEEEKRRERERLEQERIAAQKEEERRKQLMEAMRRLEAKLVESAAVTLSQSHEQCVSLHAMTKERFDDQQRISRLPMIYRDALTASCKEDFAARIWEDFSMFLPLYCVEHGDQQETWVSNAQASLILGCPHDLDLTTCKVPASRSFEHTLTNADSNFERRQATNMERQALKQNFHALHSFYKAPRDFDFNVEEESERQEAEQNKFLALPNVFWIKVSDLNKILHSDARYCDIVNKYMRNGQIPHALLWVDEDAMTD
ncbi:hypothetical protein H072_1729 [Dactylellina haptotyla CBS 200.50]|uniref:Uncharacterized protein n=1 Tax=Dactylellina haptotyla (strain CBS 200.50) TaxID=1284197 RepID=S8ATJ4_DACHA|nr:hypothetical protein H072_1729 [Dactylellina haptotyla CBS 200.50]